MELKNKTVVITGGSSGIGKATAIQYAKEGANVIIVYKEDGQGALSVKDLCAEYGGNHAIVKADLTNKNDIEKLVAFLAEKYHAIEILVNNAGIFMGSKTASDGEIFQAHFDVNLLSIVHVTDALLPLIKQGKIVMVSSIHGRLGHGRPEAAAYSAMKAALDNYTKNLAKELAPNILVNSVAPGKTMTSMWEGLSDAELSEEAAEQAIGRFITADEVADAILFLTKNDAMCGEILTIDGGMSLITLG
ncbi:MAG: SDR family oxidoreductase [Candidatus Dojkabacteria bacterium]|nr:MAG: SDR family oxidoreductase [Candidatus Dojkabacteria bacterium]